MPDLNVDKDKAARLDDLFRRFEADLIANFQATQAANQEYLTGLGDIQQQRAGLMQSAAQPLPLSTPQKIAGGAAAILPLLGLLAGRTSGLGRGLRDVSGLATGYLRGSRTAQEQQRERELGAGLADIQGQQELLSATREARLGEIQAAGDVSKGQFQAGTDLVGLLLDMAREQRLAQPEPEKPLSVADQQKLEAWEMLSPEEKKYAMWPGLRPKEIKEEKPDRSGLAKTIAESFLTSRGKRTGELGYEETTPITPAQIDSAIELYNQALLGQQTQPGYQVPQRPTPLLPESMQPQGTPPSLAELEVWAQANISDWNQLDNITKQKILNKRLVELGFR